MEPLVSVIIPTYNRESTIMRALNSVLSQTYSNIEVIVVDDASTDLTVKTVSTCKDDRVRLICMSENSGANAARNRGIAAAGGEYIAFQDSDDEWDRDKLQIQITDMLNRRLSASFCAHRLIQGVRKTIVPQDFDNRNKYEKELLQILANGNVVSTQTLVVKRGIFSIIGNFDEKMPRLQDYEFVIRLVQKEKIGYIPRPLVSVYRTTVSISSNVEALYRALAMLLIKHGSFLNVNSFLSAFLKIAILEKGESGIYAECTQLQDAMEKNGMDINVIQYAMEYVTRKCYLNRNVQEKLYKHQLKELKTECFAIYGAGNVAHEIYYELEHEGISPKCFLVTGPKEVDAIENTPIYTIDEWDNEDIIVIVGVSTPLQTEIVDLLIKKNYKKIICYPYF